MNVTFCAYSEGLAEEVKDVAVFALTVLMVNSLLEIVVSAGVGFVELAVKRYVPAGVMLRLLKVAKPLEFEVTVAVPLKEPELLRLNKIDLAAETGFPN
ncbi:hypothetical protein TH63_16715 [Rufibacter radiotolerans]|uniref:Uncharacterized protein n=1 Tax=Rufibacter radiotolerans TaxID=1379910 RepID=A0A0H4VNL7_9BACT|nr:hypothetical protein TH63_16715 [Rufibacter radiotolerans]